MDIQDADTLCKNRCLGEGIIHLTALVNKILTPWAPNGARKILKDVCYTFDAGNIKVSIKF